MRLHPLATCAASVLLLCQCVGAVDEPAPSLPDLCTEASEALGFSACATTVPDQARWEALSISAGAVDQLRATKYSVPARDDARLPAIYIDSNAFLLHYDLFVQAFPDSFPGLSWDEYMALVLHPTDREFHAGTISEYLLPDGERLFGFTVWDDPADPDGALSLEQAEAAWTEVAASFDLRPLAFVPSSQRQRSDAASWSASFPIHGLVEELDYEPYTIATGYGTLRFVPLGELAEAVESATLGYQDIVVLEDAPVDLERIVSGAVTGGRQSELSHLNVRSAARGTPNCYVRQPFEALQKWEGLLVRMTCGAEALEIEETSSEEAEAFWAQLQPEPVVIPVPDLEWSAIVPLLDVPSETAAERTAAVSRFGAKGASLASLYQRIDPELQLQGFVVPFQAYDSFMRSTTWTVDDEEQTLQESIDLWLEEEDFLTDASLRRERLEALRAAIEAAPQDPDLLDRLGAWHSSTWSDPEHTVRFRSSSNAEDGLRFSGAGLYDSTSACLADTLDDDTEGPSLCDPDRDEERSFERALGIVWASLWTMSAYEERAWYGIDQSQVAMAVLVNDRSKDEQANIVAFTGNPSLPGDARFLINAQEGEASVVSPEPGEVTEMSYLVIEGAAVQSIERVRASSEVPAGTWVLDDARLHQLGEALAELASGFPVDELPPDGSEVLLDSEWKVLEDGRLVIKQLRPFPRVLP